MIDAISSVFQGAGASAAVGNIAGDAIEGGVGGAALAALKGASPWTGALIGGAGGAAVGAYNNYGALTTASADPTGTATPSGLTTIPAGSSDAATLAQQYAQGDAGNSIVSGLPASGQNGVGGDAGVIGSDTNAGSTAAQAAANATGGGNSVTKGVPGGINNTSLALGALAALGSSLNKPTVGTWQTPGPSSTVQGVTYNMPLNPNYPGRTAVNPGLPTGAQPNYWQYGGPEQTYYQNNSLASFGYARGGALVPRGEWTVEQHGHHVRGPGTGTSDQVPAMLSNKEYVLTYDDVARLGALYGKGRGDPNEKGAKVLDDMRKDLAHKTGQPQFAPKKRGAALNERAVK